MINDKLTYITEAAARLSPENQDRVITAIEQLLDFQHRGHKIDKSNIKELFEMQTEA